MRHLAEKLRLWFQCEECYTVFQKIPPLEMLNDVSFYSFMCPNVAWHPDGAPPLTARLVQVEKIRDLPRR
jgi:hypothetical protein